MNEINDDDDGNDPVTRRECNLRRANVLEKINTLRREVVVAVAVSTTWITLLLLVLSYLKHV